MQTKQLTIHEALHHGDTAEQIEAIQLAGAQRREDLLPELIALLSSEDVGYFAEEVLPQFGDAASPRLRALLHDQRSTWQARYRAAGILGLLGESAAIPILLRAIGQTDTNQAYFARLLTLDPSALKKRLLRLIRAKAQAMFLATEPKQADYFAKLILTLLEVGGESELAPFFQGLQAGAKDWRVRAAAEAALAR